VPAALEASVPGTIGRADAPMVRQAALGVLVEGFFLRC
jgi:hypothetical protein